LDGNRRNWTQFAAEQDYYPRIVDVFVAMRGSRIDHTEDKYATAKKRAGKVIRH